MGKHAGKGGPGFVIADVLIHRLDDRRLDPWRERLSGDLASFPGSKSGGGCIGFYEAHVSASRGPRP